jgi:hypothetical protein
MLTFILRISAAGKNAGKMQPGSQPPKNNIVMTEDISNILLYSPKKNIAKIIDEYSTLYPATNSASASGKSNGALLVSASIEIKKIIVQGNKGNTNHPVMLCI